MSEPIAQIDLAAGIAAARAEIDRAIARVLDSGWYILGGEVRRFESAFAAYLGLGHGVGVANGTDAIVLALKALGIGPGDRVATVAHTAVATVAAIELAGAEPVLVDVEPATMTLDPVALAIAFERVAGIKAVIPVHLYGGAADLGRILDLADRHGALVIEDCAQAHGALLDGRRLGTLGAASTFSFYPTKNLGALGDGGLVATADADVAAKLRELREYGWRERYVSAVAGMNSRLDELQAAILAVRLAGLDRANERRRAIAGRYDRGLAGLGLALPTHRAGCVPVYHQYVVRHPDRDGLRARLKDRAIGTNIHYPVPVHRQPAYEGRLITVPDDLPATVQAAREVLSLPIYPELPDHAVERVVEAVSGSIDE